jgi:hypothetical protein
MRLRILRSVFVVMLAVLVTTGLLGCNLINSPQLKNAIATLTASAGDKATTAPKNTVAGKATTAPKATVEGEATAESTATTAPKATAAGKATVAPKATAKPKPSATTAPATQELVVVDQGFGQEELEVGYGIVVENPGESAISDSEYQVTFYDADGAVLDTETGYLGLILPGQRLNIGDSVYLSEGQVADTMEVNLNTGDAVETEFNAPLVTEQVLYRPDEFYSSVLGVISNPFSWDIQGVEVWSVAYDEAGKIIGGGSTYLSFISGGTSTGVDMYITSNGTVASVELNAAMSSNTNYENPDERVGVEDVTLLTSGYGQKEEQVSYGALFENASANAVESLNAHITFYADNGDVLGVEDAYIAVILPGETQAIAGYSSVPAGLTLGSMEIQYRVYQMVEVPELKPLTTAKLATRIPSSWRTCRWW